MQTDFMRLAFERDVDVALRNEQAQALRMGAEDHRCLQLESLAVNAGVCLPRPRPDLERLAVELEGMAAARPLAGEGQHQDLCRLCAGRGRDGKDTELPRVETEALGRVRGGFRATYGLFDTMIRNDPSMPSVPSGVANDRSKGLLGVAEQFLGGAAFVVAALASR